MKEAEEGSFFDYLHFSGKETEDYRSNNLPKFKWHSQNLNAGSLTPVLLPMTLILSLSGKHVSEALGSFRWLS